MGKLIAYLISIIILALITYQLISHFNLALTGNAAFRVFLSIAAFSGVTQTINLGIATKFTDILKIEGLNFHSRNKLQREIHLRRREVYVRAAVGMFCSYITIAFAAFLSIYDKNFIDIYLLTFMITITLVSTVLLFLSLLKSYKTIELEADLLEGARKEEMKASALKEIRQ